MPLVIAINAGATSSASLNGVNYQADKYSTGGTTNSTADPIAGVAQGTLYQTERYGTYSYEIPVLSGTYTLELHMAEIYNESSGLRSFNVSIENNEEITELDLYSQAGHDGAYSFVVEDVPVNDGSLSIDLESVVDNATLSGFAVYSNDGGIDTSVPEPEPSNCNGYVGITFDDGPDTSTSNLVNTLAQNDLTPVTFFVNGNKISNFPSAITQMLTVGVIQSHAFTHANMVSSGYSYQQAYDSLNQNSQAIQNAGAPKPTVYRPPEGASNSEHQRAARDLGMVTITWDVDSQDWNNASTSAIVNANNQLQNGQVILMHDHPNHPNTVSAIPQIAANLKAKGLCPGKLDPNTGRAVAP